MLTSLTYGWFPKLGIDALRAFGTLGTINRARRRTVYDENGNLVRRGTFYSTRDSQRGTIYSATALAGSQNSPLEMRKRLPSNNATLTAPNGTHHSPLPSPPVHAHTGAGAGHVTFPTLAPASIKETDETESEPTMSALLRRENVVPSPEPISPSPSYLGARLAVSTTPSAESTVRQHKKSAPTTPMTPSVQPDLQRPMSMPDMKEQTVESDGKGGVKITIQEPVP